MYDRRDAAARGELSWCDSFNEATMTATVTVYDVEEPPDLPWTPNPEPGFWWLRVPFHRRRLTRETINATVELVEVNEGGTYTSTSTGQRLPLVTLQTVSEHREWVGFLSCVIRPELPSKEETWGIERDELEVEVPCVFAVCGTCDGKGSHVNPSIDAHGITGEEWERDWSPEERESYMSGGYDVACNECGGKRVVPELDRERTPEWVVKALDDKAQADAEDAWERAAERRMGC